MKIKGLTIKDESGSQRTFESSNEGMENLSVTIYDGTSASCIGALDMVGNHLNKMKYFVEHISMKIV